MFVIPITPLCDNRYGPATPKNNVLNLAVSPRGAAVPTGGLRGFAQMENELQSKSAGSGWSSIQVYVMGVICLALGVALGYLFRGSQTQSSAATVSSESAPTAQTGMPPQRPTLDQMKQMADKKAEPLLAQLKNNPKNADLLKQVARIYEGTHQFQEAAGYYGKALQINPKDVATRTETASCLYYNGDVDGALAQLQQALKDNPKDANSLFNLGMMRWKGKNDTSGAVLAWNELLKSNPKLEAGKKSQVEKLIAEAKQGLAN
jgi:cytochrome c-type biogenesis protein CcmH/NrfG